MGQQYVKGSPALKRNHHLGCPGEITPDIDSVDLKDHRRAEYKPWSTFQHHRLKEVPIIFDCLDRKATKSHKVNPNTGDHYDLWEFIQFDGRKRSNSYRTTLSYYMTEILRTHGVCVPPKSAKLCKRYRDVIIYEDMVMDLDLLLHTILRVHEEECRGRGYERKRELFSGAFPLRVQDIIALAVNGSRDANDVPESRFVICMPIDWMSRNGQPQQADCIQYIRAKNGHPETFWVAQSVGQELRWEDLNADNSARQRGAFCTM